MPTHHMKAFIPGITRTPFAERHDAYVRRKGRSKNVSRPVLTQAQQERLDKAMGRSKA